MSSLVAPVLLGNGNNQVDIADGTLAGAVNFGAGDNRLALSGDAIVSGKLQFGAGSDAVTLGGTSAFNGAAGFGGGRDTLMIGGTSLFKASLANSGGLAVTVNGGTFGVVKSSSISSLSVTNGGTLSVVLDKTPGNSSRLTVAGAATFGDKFKLQLAVANVAQ